MVGPLMSDPNSTIHLDVVEGGEMADIHDIGEKPGVGRYCCTNCGWSVYLDNTDDRLPPCGSCGKGQDTKYRHC
jgi:ribosomal protein S27AE